MSTTVTSELTQQEREHARLVKHVKAIRDNISQVSWMIAGLERDDIALFLEGWDELEDEAKKALWISSKTGGIWTPAERKLMRKFWSEI